MKVYFCWTVILITLVGCASGLTHQEVPATSQPILLPTQTIVLAPTEADVATATFVPTSTSIPPQPINTPSQKEKDQITLELLQTNNGCDLPCLWGIIPNETRWSDAQTFLKIFSKISEKHPPNEWDVYEVHAPLPVEFSDVYAARVVFAAQEGIVREIEIGYFDEKTYHLSSFLQKYGTPTEILISTYSSDSGLPKDQVPLSINLYYPEKGINALYGTYATVNGEQIDGCFETSPVLFLWSPEEHTRTINYIVGWDTGHTPYLSIQHIGLDTQEFYEKYVNYVNVLCMQTPTDLWQSQ